VIKNALALLAAISSLGPAFATEAAPANDAATTYGALYSVEDRTRHEPGWELGLSTGYEFSNPYANVFQFGLSPRRRINEFFSAGLSFQIYSIQATDLSRAVTTSGSGSESVSARVGHPQFDVHAVGAVSPLSGRINWFNTDSVPFDLPIVVGFGVSRAADQPARPNLLWRLEPRVQLSRSLDLFLGIGQQVESPFTSNAVSRTTGTLGVITRL
jgi:hypothetical protein